MDADTYQGWANRETWAFNANWSNDEPIYRQTLRLAEHYLTETYGPDWSQLPEDEAKAATYGVGQYVIDFWRDLCRDDDSRLLYAPMADDVGSWWRVDAAEVGEAVRESISVEA